MEKQICMRINEDMACYQHILSLQNKNNIVRCFEYRRLIEAGYSVLYGTGRAIDAENSLSIKQVSTLNTAIAAVALAESVSNPQSTEGSAKITVRGPAVMKNIGTENPSNIQEESRELMSNFFSG